MTSLKTEQLVESLPDAYGAADPSTVLHMLLDAVGAELMVADAKIKRLVKSHWVDHADGGGLDGLGAAFGVQRRRLPDGKLEDDARFRRRLRSVVALFTGGGTIEAVTGAVRSALGLPFHLELANLPVALRDDLERLVSLEEFSPTPEVLVFDAPAEVDRASEIAFDVETRTALEADPRIEWAFPSDSGRALSLERLDEGGGPRLGVQSRPELVVPKGGALVLTTTTGGAFSAVLNGSDASSAFTSLDGASPPHLPSLPREPSRWVFRAAAATFGDSTFTDAGAPAFGETFDLPRFAVKLAWTRTQPLTFDVTVPYFLKAAVDAIVDRHHYPGEIFAFEGLPRETIQQVVDDARAAGVRGNVHFSLTFAEDQAPREPVLRIDGLRRFADDHRATEVFTIGSVNSTTERHSAVEAFALAAEFDIATFDGPFGTV